MSQLISDDLRGLVEGKSKPVSLALTSCIDSIPGEAYSLRHQNVPSVTCHDVYPPGVRYVRGDEKRKEVDRVEVQVTRRLRQRLDAEWRNDLGLRMIGQTRKTTAEHTSPIVFEFCVVCETVHKKLQCLV